MSKVYEFEAQKIRGDMGATRLDAFFSDRFIIEPVDMRDEWRGIDRNFKDKSNGKSFTVEYKTDSAAAHTHNVFVETVSNDISGRPGWAFTCEADYILVYIPLDEIVYVVRPRKLKVAVGSWLKKYPQKPCKNRGYNTVGMPVPLCEFEKIAETAISL